MAIRKYRCKSPNCGKPFEADEYRVQECTHCGSKSFGPDSPPGIWAWIKKQYSGNPKLFWGLAGGIVLLFLFFRGCNSSTQSTEKYSVNYDTAAKSNPYVDLIIEKRSKDEDGNPKEETLNGPALCQFIAAMNFRYKDGRLVQFDPNICNRFYPCDSTFSITWDTLTFKTRDTTLVINSVKIDKSQCNCTKRPEVLMADAMTGCSLEIRTNYDSIKCPQVIKVSILGKKGPYQSPPFKFNLTESPYKADIWMIAGTDTTEYVKNGNLITLPGCVPPPSPAALETIKNSLINLCNRYASNPSDYNYEVELNNHLRGHSTGALQISIGGNMLQPTGMFSKISSDYPDIQYRIDPSSIIIDRDGMIVKFAWIKK